MISLQVTIPAGGVSGPITSTATMASVVIIENNATHPCRFGGPNITAAGPGVLLAAGSPGGSGTIQVATPSGVALNELYIAGTAGDVIDVSYEPNRAS